MAGCTICVWQARKQRPVRLRLQLTPLAHAQTSAADLCLSYYEHQCAGICSSEKRLAPIYQSCLQDPLRTGANPGNLPEIDEGNIQKV